MFLSRMNHRTPRRVSKHAAWPPPSRWRSRKTKGKGRLVRRLDIERTLSRRRKEDAWLRARGANGVALARCNYLPHGRRYRFDRNVESVRRDATHGLDLEQAPANGDSAG